MSKFKLTKAGRAVVGVVLTVAVAIGIVGGIKGGVLKFDKKKPTASKPSTSISTDKPSNSAGDDTINLSLDEWAGWLSCVTANGGLTTQPGSVFDQLGIKVNINVINDATESSNALISGDLQAAGYTTNRVAFLSQKFTDAGKNVIMPIFTNYSYGGRYYVLNQNNRHPGTITVKGGTFVNYDPSTGDDNLHGSFVPAGYSVVSSKQANGDVWYTVVSNTSHEGLQEALNNGGELTVSSEIKTNNIDDTADARLIISKPTTLNLNAKIVTPNGMTYNGTNFCALIVDADTTINAGENGGIDTGKDGAYGINVRKGATLTINGGHYYGGGTAVQVQQGTLVINGGTFAVEPFGDPYGYNFLLNCIDSAFKDGSAKIIVKGGTFVNFDPSNNTAEGAGTNFVADGYKVVSSTQANGEIWYTVVAK